MKKKLFIIAGVLVAILIALGVGLTYGLSEGASVNLSGINPSSIPDGSYTGNYDFWRWSNTVAVHIKDGNITAIDMVKDVSAAFVTNCADEVFQRVITAQDTQVDAVSGATVTSKAYLKAIEDALSN